MHGQALRDLAESHGGGPLDCRSRRDVTQTLGRSPVAVPEKAEGARGRGVDVEGTRPADEGSGHGGGEETSGIVVEGVLAVGGDAAVVGSVAVAVCSADVVAVAVVVLVLVVVVASRCRRTGVTLMVALVSVTATAATARQASATAFCSRESKP